ncbi:MAG TPA: efflux RND transporter periplasmic adaptor subunit [Chthoniobacterales bacterium]|jgi:multidrug efflux system membrane fusion protein|nr:efflux RND transporter periplasmic adaptor subunit [Chthoniobacterales bacterium]
MIAAQKVGLATREAVNGLEQRFGRKSVYLGGGILGIVGLLLLIRFVTSGHKATPPPPPRPVAVAKVITRDVPLYLDEIGTCAAFETVQVQAQVSGQIIARHFKDGQDVKKGDLLFTIDPRPYQAVLDSAKADLMLAEANLKRQEELRAKQVTAKQDWDTAKATAMKAQAVVDAAQVNLDFTQIRSPIEGRIGLRQVDVGNTVSAGATSAVLVTIDNLDPIYTDFTVAEPDMPQVRKYLGGPNVKVLTQPPNSNVPPRSGTLYFIANTVTPGTGTVQARGVTPNPDRLLWPSEFVNVRLVLDILKNAMLVPNDAVQMGQNGPYVFVVKPDQTLDLRQVTPGQRQDGELLVVTKGLKPGETVVTAGQLQLAPGTKVAIKSSTNPAQQPLSNQATAVP